MTQKERVLRAVREGYDNTLEIEAVTGLPVKHVSALLFKLRDEGLIQQKGSVTFGRYRKVTYLWRETPPRVAAS
jgi:hypothetical protein